MAIAVSGGHVNRALDFIKAKENMYFIIGGTQPWKTVNADTGVEEVTETPPAPEETDFRLTDIIGLKKVDEITPVILTTDTVDNPISYKDQTWKRVPVEVKTTLKSPVIGGDSALPVNSVVGFKVGDKIRIADSYETTIYGIHPASSTLDISPQVPSDANFNAGDPVLAGALVEGAKYIYVSCQLAYDKFPVKTYRQIGICTGVVPNRDVLVDRDNVDILRSAASGETLSGLNEYLSTGVLEILDNRVPTNRSSQQKEQISLIIEF